MTIRVQNWTINEILSGNTISDRFRFIYIHRSRDSEFILMEIYKVTENKKEYLDLLLLADEQEDMVDKYLYRGEMFVLDDNGVKAECVVTKESDGVYELKNIAVKPDYQQKGYGKVLIKFVLSYYVDCRTMLVGTGDIPAILNFYKQCGFVESHRINNFFTDNYDHPMYENGTQLVDMVYLKKDRWI